MTDKTRFLESKIDRLLSLFPVVAIVGPRQCGKSTLVKKLRPDWRYYDLERPDDYQLVTSDPLGFFSRRREATIIDEAQQYPDLFRVLRGVVDQDRKATGRYLLTGSSSPEIVKGGCSYGMMLSSTYRPILTDLCPKLFPTAGALQGS